MQVKAFPIEFCGSSEFLRAVRESTDETFVESLSMAASSTQGRGSGVWGRQAGQTLGGSFSSVPKLIFGSEYSF